MAELTLSQKATLSENHSFLKRLHVAAFAKAKYFLDLAEVDITNMELHKSRTYAKEVSQKQIANIYAYAKTFLAYYTNANEAVRETIDGIVQPNDAEMLDSGATDLVFKRFAGVVAGDNLIVYPEIIE